MLKEGDDFVARMLTPNRARGPEVYDTWAFEGFWDCALREVALGLYVLFDLAMEIV